LVIIQNEYKSFIAFGVPKGMIATQDPGRPSLWVGANVICKEEFSTEFDDIPVKIPVGTKAVILAFEGPYIMVNLTEGNKGIDITQLRGDFLYFWELDPESIPPKSRVFQTDRSMILDQHPGFPGKKTQFKYIGFWATNEDPQLCSYAQKLIVLPWPGHFVDPCWDRKERDLVIDYLKKAPDVEHWRGNSWCRFKCVKYLEGYTDKGDGVFVWPEGFAHYVEKHNVRPPEEFVKHVLEQLKRQTPFMNLPAVRG
jgi:hypothetical protein